MNGECRPLGCEPLFSRGEVIRGFGRGSKDLGIPTGNSAKHIPCDKPTLCTETWETLSAYVEVDCLPVSRKKNFRGTPSSISFPATANYPEDVVENLPDNFETGIYYGWASVNRGPVYKMVMSVGWNPFYKNQKKSMVSHTNSMLIRTAAKLPNALNHPEPYFNNNIMPLSSCLFYILWLVPHRSPSLLSCYYAPKTWHFIR